MNSESEPRKAFGAADRISCPHCSGAMIVVRRALSHKHRGYEYQILECAACGHTQDRTINMRGEVLA